MRISTSQTFKQGLNVMTEQQSRVAITQLQLSEGKRILNPSDDPIGTSIALNLRQQINAAEQYAKNGKSAQNALNTEESALDNVSGILGRVRDLLVQAGNGALSFEDRKTISIEVQGRLDELVAVGNTQTADGKFLFSGFKTDARSFTKDAAGNYVYNGDQGDLVVQVNSSVNIKAADNGSDLFMSVPTGNGSFETRQSDLNNGTGIVGPAVMSNSGAFISDSYTIDFFVDGGGVTRYTISGATSGQVVPPPPAVIATDSPQFIEGGDIEFSGIKLDISGIPVDGDSFTVEPSRSQSLFQTVAEVVTSLQLANDSDAMLAHYENAIGRALRNIDQGLAHVDAFRSNLGTRLNIVESETNINESIVVQAQGALSLVEDLDYAEAITRLNRQTVALQAAQQSFVQIQRLNIFEYM